MDFTKTGVKVTPIKMNDSYKEDLEKNLMLFYMGERDSTKIHESQIAHIEENIKFYDCMKSLAAQTYGALTHNQIDTIGYLLNRNWAFKKRLSERISDGKINALIIKL